MATQDESKLTDRQREVLELVRDRGYTTTQASDQLGISYNAANEHVRNLRKKGFLNKSQGRSNGRSTSRNGSASTPAPAAGTKATGSNGRFGRVAVKLQEAEEEAKAVRQEITAEIEELSRRQSELAAEAEGVENLSQDIHQRVEALV